LHARVWRQKRSIYHTLSDDQCAEIRAKWQAWTGPTTALYFAYIVDTVSGEYARRAEVARADTLAIRRRVLASLPEQTALEIA